MAARRTPKQAPMVSISGGPSPQTIEAIRDAVMVILEAHADQKTIRLALEVTQRALSAPLTIQNCSFNGGEGRD